MPEQATERAESTAFDSRSKEGGLDGAPREHRCPNRQPSARDRHVTASSKRSVSTTARQGFTHLRNSPAVPGDRERAFALLSRWRRPYNPHYEVFASDFESLKGYAPYEDVIADLHRGRVFPCRPQRFVAV